MPTDFSHAPPEIQQEVLDCYRGINEWYGIGVRALEAREFKRAKEAFDGAWIINNRLEYLNEQWDRLNAERAIREHEEAADAWKSHPDTRDYLTARPHRKGLLNFALKRNLLRRGDAPAVKLISRDAMAALRPGSPDAWGMYIRASNTVLIADDLSDEDEVATVLHEHVHAYERFKGWQGNENFALLQEGKFVAEWKTCNQQEFEEW